MAHKMIDADMYNIKTGTIIHNLSYIGYSHYDKYHYVLVRCTLCGTEKSMVWGAFLYGLNKSCGCKRNKDLYDRSFKHGLCSHLLYYKYNHLKKANRLSREWKNNFKDFYDWCMGNGWKKGSKIKCNSKNKIHSPKTCLIIKN